MDSFVINLTRAPNRLRRFQEAARFFGWTVERYNAIDADDLLVTTSAEGLELVAHRLIKDVRLTARPTGRLHLPHYACALSHMRLWQLIASNQSQPICVFEDDAIIERAPDIGSIPKDADFIFINDRVSCLLPDRISDVPSLTNWLERHRFAPLVPGCGTEAYVVTPKGARKGLRLMSPMFWPIDLQLMAYGHGSHVAEHPLTTKCVPGIPTCRIYATTIPYTQHVDGGISYINNKTDKGLMI